MKNLDIFKEMRLLMWLELGIALTLPALISGCSMPSLPEADEELVIEGWIENGGNPIVIVTGTVPVSTEKADLDDLADYVIRWATVSVSDGKDTFYLEGRYDENYFPPYIYTTDKLVGETGKTYHLKVVCEDKTATSSATIPPCGELEGLETVPADEKGHYNITATLLDNPETKDQYKLFIMKRGKDTQFRASMFGLIDDETIAGGRKEIQVTDCLDFYLTRYHPYFDAEDIVDIRLSTMQEDVFEYWKDYEEVTSLSKNPLFPVSTHIRSNIKGGFGYWAAYGSTFYTVDIAASRKPAPSVRNSRPADKEETSNRSLGMKK